MGGAKKALSKTIKKTVSGVGKTITNPSRLVKNPGKILDAVPVVNLLDSGGKGGSKSKSPTPKISNGSAPTDALSDAERVGGITPPKYQDLVGEGGNLLERYKYDPSQSAAFVELQKQAMSAPGESPWAKMQMQKQALEEQGLLDNTNSAQAQAMAQAQSNLMRFGGLGGGARTRLASQGAKDLMLAQQQARMSGIKDRLGIGEQDINRQQDLLGRVSSTELEGQGKNLDTLLGDVQGRREFDMNRYNQQMAAYGADETAKGQVKAAKKSRKK